MALVSSIYRSGPGKKKRTAAEIFRLHKNRHPSQSERRAWRVLKRLGFKRNQLLSGYLAPFVHRPKKLTIQIGNPIGLPKENRWRQAGYRMLWFPWDYNDWSEIRLALDNQGFFVRRHKGNAGYGDTVQKSVSPSQPQYRSARRSHTSRKPQ